MENVSKSEKGAVKSSSMKPPEKNKLQEAKGAVRNPANIHFHWNI